jgi:glyoxylase-like metal-dependent hydrolase (beta-lactamase superfamily II)
MEVTRLAEGLWRWTGQHPAWTPDDAGASGWAQDVASYHYEAGDAVVLFDPIVPPEDAERFWSALDRDLERAGRPAHVLLTVFWHGRSSRAIADRHDAEIWMHEHAREAEGRELEPTRYFSFGAALPGGVEARDAARFAEAVYWVPAHRALVFGDLVLGAEPGRVRLCPEGWLGEGGTHAELKELLRPLLELPVERLLVTHGEPVLEDGRAELERVLG